MTKPACCIYIVTFLRNDPTKVPSNNSDYTGRWHYLQKLCNCFELTSTNHS